jgi:protein ImuA
MINAPAKSSVIEELKKEILSLQGFKHATDNPAHLGLGPLEQAFPNHAFPVGTVHEFLSASPEAAAATNGFIAGLLGQLMRQKHACLWISRRRTLFPPALKVFGVDPHQVVFVDAVQEKDMLWLVEEALKCEALAAVVGELHEISFTASRRLQLAVEQSRVTGLLHWQYPRAVTTTASVCRWRISPLASWQEEDMPGIGFPCWQVELLKIRNGKPGTWQLGWKAGQFLHYTKHTTTTASRLQKTG